MKGRFSLPEVHKTSQNILISDLSFYLGIETLMSLVYSLLIKIYGYYSNIRLHKLTKIFAEFAQIK
jgi:hypothetical protein